MSDLLHQIQSRLPARLAELPPSHFAVLAGALASVLLLRLRKSLRARANRAQWSDWSRYVVVVTGGSAGIGAEIVKRIVAKGAKVAILDLAPPAKPHPNVRFYKTDVADNESVQRAKEQVHKELGSVTILINNAGVGNAGGDLLNADAKRLTLTVQVNTLASFYTVKAFLPDMLEADKGHVVTIASAASFLQAPRAIDYCVSKAGALSFHEGLRNEIDLFHHRPGVLTSIVHPSWVHTNMTDHLFQEKYLAKALKPHQVADAIVRQLESGQGAAVYLPKGVSVAPFLRVLPHSWQNKLRLTVSNHIIGQLKPELAAKLRDECKFKPLK